MEINISHVIILLFHIIIVNGEFEETYQPWKGNITVLLSETIEYSELLCASKCTQTGDSCVGFTFENEKCGMIKSYTQTQNNFFIKGSRIQTKILIVAGYLNGGNDYLKNIEENSVEIISLDPGETCNSSQNINVPVSTYAASGQIFQGRPTVCGGVVTTHKHNEPQKLCYSFAPLEKKWYPLPNMLNKHSWGGSAISNGRLFVIAGPYSTKLEFYDGTSWTLAPDVGYSPRKSCGVQLDSDRSMMIGGSGDSVRKTSIYSSIANSWKSGPDMLADHQDCACATMSDGRVMVVSGKITEILDPATNIWTLMADNPVPFVQSYLVIADGTPVLTGGDGTSLKGVYRWENNKWNKLNIQLKEKRAKHTAFALDAEVTC